VLAASLGIVTPFCSCSAVPLFIGFLSAGVPLGVTFSFLISAPMVNEVALALLFGMFGWKVAALYLGMGLLVAIVAGLVIGKLKMERTSKTGCAIQAGQMAQAVGEQLSWVERCEVGAAHVREIVGKVWPYVLAGIGLGAGIHGYVPRISWPRSWARTRPGGRCRPRCCSACRCTPTPRHHPDRRSADRQGRGAGHRAGLHDGGDRAVGAGDDHPAQGAEADPDRHLRRSGGHRHPAGRLRLQLASEKGVAITLEKVESLPEIMRHGVMSTPGVVIDGRVVHAGGVPARSKVEGWL
jgi:hypothetical protein